MLSLRSVTIVCGFLCLSAACNTSPAGWGFPTHGAWAYGSGCGGYGTSYWGGHHGWSTTSYYRTSYRSSLATTSWGHGLGRVRSFYPRTTWYATTLSIPTLRASFYYPRATVAPVYCAPTYHYLPTYYQPTHYWAPTYSWPTCSTLPNYSVNYVNPLCLNALPAHTGSSVVLAAHATDSSQVGRLVTVDNPATQLVVNTIPPQLLATADAILQAGGYRQAATAYAQLHVRYGSSNAIFTRRFVAQIASGDFDQAAVVLASAQAAGFQLQPSELPASQLATLLPGRSQEVDRLTERLAAQALSSNNEREALQLMSAWLGLSGDESRAGLFLAMAERLSNEGQPALAGDEQPIAEELPSPRSKSEYVSLE